MSSIRPRNASGMATAQAGKYSALLGGDLAGTSVDVFRASQTEERGVDAHRTSLYVLRSSARLVVPQQ